MSQPTVGIGVLIFNHAHQILLGKRKGSHGAEMWTPPGGNLHGREAFEDCAIRTVKEETDLSIAMPEFLAVTNNIFEENDMHTLTIFMCAHFPEDQVVTNRVTDHIVAWEWIDVKKLPQKLFLPMKNLLAGEGKDLLLELTGTADDAE